MINKKILKISQNLKENEALLISSDITRQYLTGFKSSAGELLITNKKAVLLIDSRYFEKASATIKDIEVLLLKNKFKQVEEFLTEANITELYCETTQISLNEYQKLKNKFAFITLLDDDKFDLILNEMRAVKSAEELDFIRYAQKLTDDTFLHILNFIKEGKAEKETALEMEYFIRDKGSDGIAFDFIVVSGKNSSLPHGVPTDKVFEIGDFITMDFGARYNGYCADMTRTVVVGGLTNEQIKVYNTVLSAQNAALLSIKSGAPCKDIDKIARDIISNAGYGEYFGHALGHSIGLFVHETPSCSPKSNDILKTGNLMTVEPGIYIPQKFGVRIEDLVVVTDDGYENLTKSPKDIIIL